MDASSDSAFGALAAKVDRLGQLCARLARENADLHEQVSRLRGAASATSRPPAPMAGSAQSAGGQPAILEGRVTRRMAGRTLGVAAAGIMGAAALTELGSQPAAASDGQSLLIGRGNPSETPTTVGYDGPATTKITTMFLVNDSDFGPSDSLFSCALAGWSGPGRATGAGSTDTGVFGFTSSGTGHGVVGVSIPNTSPRSGSAVLGRGQGGVVGVRGTSDKGHGGEFSGGAAQIRLMPGKPTHPRSGNRGELYADSNGRLWFCKASGAKATWHQIA
jgi:hypothetical protein